MTDISMFTGGIAQTNGYLVKLPCGTILVDAPEGVASWLKRQGADVDALLLTHQHFDHVLGAAEVVADHGCPVLAWAPLSKDLTLERLFGAVTGTAYSVPEFTVDEVLEGRAEMDLFTHVVKLFHIPGHSPDSVCFYLPEQGLLFGGDVLFLRRRDHGMQIFSLVLEYLNELNHAAVALVEGAAQIQNARVAF